MTESSGFFCNSFKTPVAFIVSESPQETVSTCSPGKISRKNIALASAVLWAKNASKWLWRKAAIVLVDDFFVHILFTFCLF